MSAQAKPPGSLIGPRTLIAPLAPALCALTFCAQAFAAVAAVRGPASRGSIRQTESVVAAVVASSNARASQSKPPQVTKVYRGSINGRGVEIILRREGGRASGSYKYDGAAERLRLAGSAAPDGKLALEAFDRAGRREFRLACEPGGGVALDIDLDCEWSRARGSYQTYARLTEQHAPAAPSAGAWRVEPRFVVNRRYGVRVTFPVIVAARGSRLAPGALAFNRAASALASGLVREFAAGPPERGMYLRADYDVLLATDDLISVELEEERDFGGGRPGTRYFGLTYDLRTAGRELKLEDLFKTDSEFERALLVRAYERINRNYREIKRREAAAGSPPPEDEDLMQPGGGGEIAAWALTPRGIVIYFNFPQVTAVFDRNFVPYDAIRELLRADGPAAGAARAAR